MHRRNVASAPIGSIKEEEDVPTSTPITMRPPKRSRGWLNLEIVRLAVPVLAGGNFEANSSSRSCRELRQSPCLHAVVVLVLVLLQLPYFHRCPGPGKQ